tara:strand:+ start:780 stop:1031 length:252 start_codon:yes stop_codon:yes gene_type:complete
MKKAPFVMIEDLSKQAGVSTATIRRWVRNGHLPDDTFIHIGQTYRFDLEGAMKALTSSKVGDFEIIDKDDEWQEEYARHDGTP